MPTAEEMAAEDKRSIADWVALLIETEHARRKAAAG
jgi:hypothetical protein